MDPRPTVSAPWAPTPADGRRPAGVRSPRHSLAVPCLLVLLLAVAPMAAGQGGLEADLEPLDDLRVLPTDGTCKTPGAAFVPLPDGRAASLGTDAVDFLGSLEGDVVLRFWGADLEPVREVRVVRLAEIHESDPRLAAHPEAGLLVIWYDAAEERYRGQRFNDEGDPLDPAHVLLEGDVVVGEPVTAMRVMDAVLLPDGSFVLLTITRNRWIHLHRFGPGGSVVAPPVLVQPFTRQGRIETYGRDAVATPTEEGVLVLWHWRRSDTLDSQSEDNEARLLARAFTPSGPTGPEHQIDATEPVGYFDNLWLERTPDGGVIAAWSRSGDPLRFRRLDGSGRPLQEVVVPVVVGGTRTGMAVDEVGRLAVVWVDRSAAEVRLQLLSAAGEPLGEPFVQPTDFGHDWAVMPHPLSRGAGRFDLLWRRFQQTGVLPSFCGELTPETYVRRLASGCVAGETGHCLQDGRFRVSVDWRDQHNGGSGRGRALPLTPDSGGFWFFREENVELVAKVLDGRPVNGHFWLFYASLSDVGYRLTVADAEAPRSRDFVNPPGTLASFGTSTLFADPDLAGEGSAVEAGSGAAELAGDLRAFTWAPGAVEAAATSACGADTTVGCLHGDRFEVEVEWTDPFNGGTGRGTAVPVVDAADPESVGFWFFSEDNLELVVKVLDGRPVNGHWWVFYGSLTNVGFRLTVTDRDTGQRRTWENPPRHFDSRGTTDAFAAP